MPTTPIPESEIEAVRRDLVAARWSFALLQNAFTDLAAALSRLDSQGALTMIESLSNRVVAQLREEMAKGIDRQTIANIGTPLHEAMKAAKQAIESASRPQ